MALKQESKDKIKAFGFDVDKLIAAVTAADEVDYEVPEDVTVIKTADLVTRDANKVKEGEKAGETKGEAKGKELAAKAFRKKFNLDDNIGVDVDKVVEAVNAKLSQGDQGLKDQVSLLLKDKESLIKEKADYEKRAADAAWDVKLISHFPTDRSKDLTDSERLALVKMNFQFEQQDGKTVVKRNGEILRSKDSQSPIDPQQAIADFFTEKKWIGNTPPIPPHGGRGGGDNPPPPPTNGIKTASAFEAKWKAENPGKNLLGDEYLNALAKQSKEVQDFDMYS
ncbi:MAG: hypothetical protein KF862_07245 [Chitinophagaceae bacterium]|nr:hypothetical protein [Chitinophagaceae bacterium]